MRVVAVVRRSGQKQQPVTALRDDFSQASPLRLLAIHAGTADAVMCLIDDSEVPGGALELLEPALWFGKGQRDQTERDGFEWIAAELEPAPLLLQRIGI